MSNSVAKTKEDGNSSVIEINELPYYTYFSLITLLLDTEGDVSQMRDFRFNSLLESEMWDNAFGRLTPKKKLLFYCFFDELRNLIVEEEVLSKQRENDNFPEKAFLFNLRCIIVVGTLTLVLKRKVLQNIFDSMEGGEYINAFISSSDVLFNEYRKSLWWERGAFGEDKIYNILKQYRLSSFSKNQLSVYKRLSFGLTAINRSRILDEFYSLFKASQKHTPTHVKSEYEDNVYILFTEQFPIWTKKNGNNSFYSYLFSSLMNHDDEKNLISHLENIRVFYFSPLRQRKRVLRTTVMEIFKKSVNRQQDHLDFSNEDAKFIAELLVSSGGIEDVKSFILKSISKKIIEKQKINISDIVKKEVLVMLSIFEQAEEHTEKKAQDGLKLFLTNIFQKIKTLLTSEEPLLYGTLSEQDKASISLVLSEIIKQELEVEKELLGYFA